MAQSLPSPPLSRAATPGQLSEGPDAAESMAKLDDLLAQYLDHLDQYTKLREQISRQFSEGFFTLARAQRTSNMGAGRRYGQDGYDSRMKAIRRVTIDTQSSDGDNDKDGITYTCLKYNRIAKGPLASSKSVSDVPNQSNSTVLQKKESSQDSEDKQKTDASFRDPSTWFGLFVSPLLRESQQHFIQVCETLLPSLACTKSAMEALEQEIWAVRDDLGLRNDYVQDNHTSPDKASDDLARIDRLLAKAKVSSKS